MIESQGNNLKNTKTIEKNNKHALTFIFITMLIDITGIGIIVPGLPDLLKNMNGGTLSDASIEGGWLMFAYAIMQFFFSPILGALSDQFGRRPVILASLLGFGVDYLFTGFATSIEWLFIGRIFAGIFGASFSTAGAYIADVSPVEKRAQNFGLIGAAFGIGFILGPIIGSLIAQMGFNERVPFFVAAGLAFLNFIYGYIVLPESLKPENVRNFDWKRANPFGTLSQLFKYKSTAELVLPYVLLSIAGYATQATWSYYTREKFAWTTKDVAYSLAFVGLMAAVVQGGLSRKIIPKLGLTKSIFLGLILNIIGMICFGMANAGWMMYATTIIASFGGIAAAALQGVMSNSIPPNAQGEFRGGITSIMSLTAIIGPLMMSSIFAYFTEKTNQIYLPGAPFYAGAVLMIICLLIVLKVLGMRSK
jgi:MFS transporter, DHA1 family, tetracycline resistance protein